MSRMEVLEIGCEIDHCENPEDWIWRVLFFCLCVLFFSSKASTFSWLYDHILLFMAICIGLFLILRPRLFWWILKGGVGKVWKTNVTLRSDEVSLF